MLNNLTQFEPHDYTGQLFIGKVLSNTDPLNLRRIKVLIPNMFEQKDPTKLPWIAPLYFGPVANTPGGTAGSYNLAPQVNSEVIVMFQEGSPLHGLYIGSPIRSGNVVSSFGGADSATTYGWKDPAGNMFLVNTKSGSRTITLIHASGATISISNSGAINVVSPVSIAMGAPVITMN
jgi:hypothetical protein